MRQQNRSIIEETLSRVAGCLGLGLEKRDQGRTAGFVLFDLRDPDNVVFYSMDPDDPVSLDDAAEYLKKRLENLDPDELELGQVVDMLVGIISDARQGQ